MRNYCRVARCPCRSEGGLTSTEESTTRSTMILEGIGDLLKTVRSHLSKQHCTPVFNKSLFIPHSQLSSTYRTGPFMTGGIPYIFVCCGIRFSRDFQMCSHNFGIYNYCRFSSEFCLRFCENFIKCAKLFPRLLTFCCCVQLSAVQFSSVRLSSVRFSCTASMPLLLFVRTVALTIARCRL